jgi:hypothetical protein
VVGYPGLTRSHGRRHRASQSARFPLRALQASLQTRQARAADKVAKLAPVIAELRAAVVASQRAIAATLNERGVPTPSGHGNWGSMQVARLLKRLAG